MLSPDDFVMEVDRMMREGASCLDAAITWCQRHGLEPEAIADFIKKNPMLRARLQLEAESLSLVKRDE